MARKKNIVNIFNPPKSRVQFSEGQKSKGILDDFPIRQNVKVSETPVQNDDAANKKYVDDAVAGGGGSDEKVKVDAGATAGYLGAASNDGVLRTGAPLTYADGGDFITLDVDETAIDHDVLANTHNNPYTLDEIDDPAGNTAFSMGSNDLKFQFSNPASDGFNIEAIGAFSGDVLHVHQHTGNPGAVNLVGLEAVDTDVTPILVTTSAGEAMKLDHSGNLSILGTVDGIDIATDVAANTTHSGGDGSDHADVATNSSHVADNTQAHTDYLINNGNDSTSGDLTVANLITAGNVDGVDISAFIDQDVTSGSGPSFTNAALTTPALGTPSAGVLSNCTALPAAQVAAGTFAGALEAADHGAAATDQIVNVSYGTGAAPAANTTTIGSLYITHEA